MSHSKQTSDPFIKLFGSSGAPRFNDTIGASVKKKEEEKKIIKNKI